MLRFQIVSVTLVWSCLFKPRMSLLAAHIDSKIEEKSTSFPVILKHHELYQYFQAAKPIQNYNSSYVSLSNICLWIYILIFWKHLSIFSISLNNWWIYKLCKISNINIRNIISVWCCPKSINTEEFSQESMH